jgi:4-amino-4-deoxy-L-arabinose transferase-like glycosyltransferase
MNGRTSDRTWNIAAGMGVVGAYLALAIVRALTEAPIVDEGYFANAAFNLMKTGRMATTVLETENSPLTRIDQHTYWIMPLHPASLAGWFKLFGFGVFQLRLFSIFWGLVALVSWFAIVRELWGRDRLALLAVGFLSVDYIFISCASSGRMDTMCAALGSAAIATFLVLRTRHLTLAVLLSQTLIVACGLTHPMGILFFFALLFISLRLDRRSLAWKLIAVAVVPYVVGAAAWGAYIGRDVEAFKDQFLTNATMNTDSETRDSRFAGLRSPLKGLKLEVTDRYLANFTSALRRGEPFGPAHFKVLILGVYVAGLFGSLMIRDVRQSPNFKLIFLATTICFSGLAFIDSQKMFYYLVHIVPFYLTMSALVVAYSWVNGRRLRTYLTAGLAFLVMFEAGGVVYRAKANSYANDFLPLADFLNTRVGHDADITASPGVALGLGFPPNVISDPVLGFNTGRTFEYIVVDPEVAQSIRTLANRPWEREIHTFITRLLSQDYTVVFQNRSYTLYQLNMQLARSRG